MRFKDVLLAGLIVLAAGATPLSAEVMDKEPTAAFNWAWGVLGGVTALIAWRVRWWMGLPTLLVGLAVWYAVNLEINDPFVGPAIRKEAGVNYVTQFYGAASVWAVLNVIGVYGCIANWRKRRRLAT